MLSHETRRLSPIVGTVLALCGTACGSSVDLAPGPQLSVSSDPNVLGVINEQVAQLVVDDERVYWIGVGSGYSLRSCKKDNCIGSLVSYANDGVMQSTGFTVVQGQVYWIATDATLRNCASPGCGSEARSVATGLNSDPRSLSYIYGAFSSDTVYLTADFEIVAVPLGDAQARPRHLHPVENPVLSMAVDGDYLYALTAFSATAPSGTIQRIRTDGTEPVQVLAANLRVVAIEGLVHRYLAIHSNDVFWPEGTLYGAVAHCPTTGCTGSEELLVEPVRSPTSLLSDGANIYWQHATVSQGFAISGCSIADCVASAPLAVGLDPYTEAAADDRYLYAATAEQDSDYDMTTTNPYASIRRIAKIMERSP